MCGITGIVAFNEFGTNTFSQIESACNKLSSRGPDNQGIYRNGQVVLGHRRLSIIDVSEAGNQPMSTSDGRFTIVFNGEFFNYKEHKEALEKSGEVFKTSSDTEVLLRLYQVEGPACLQKINGFFALAIYDKQTQTIFMARDRMGIKPFFYYLDSDRLAFASEMKALVATGIPKSVDRISLLNYLQLNYIPGPWSVFEGVRKLKPGHYIHFKVTDGKSSVSETRYYEIKNSGSNANDAAFSGTYKDACVELKNLLSQSVQRRMISDVPLGAFLSGGIDSSVIVALASRYTSHLNTFSIGYKDEPMYDETRYAKLVADRYKTNHTVFSLSNDDLFEHVFNVLEYIDEPFADSSALAVNILSLQTRKHVTVSLSGDGADEMFGGYNKHRAEWIIKNKRSIVFAASVLSPMLSPFGGSRGNPLANKIRQIHRFAEGSKMSTPERYWRWCGYTGESEIDALTDFDYDTHDYFRRKKEILKPLNAGNSMNDVLLMDMNLVLPNDMLVKVDMMSMANSLEVRVPFLDHTVVDFAFSLPSSFKITENSSKKILRETFRKDLPDELFNRPKHGFEVPLLKWFRTGLRSLIEELLGDAFIHRQGLFDNHEIANLKNRLFSNNPGDIEARIWGLIVFQYWWKKYMD